MASTTSHAAVRHAATPPPVDHAASAASNAAAPPGAPGPFWHWSIAEAWDWTAHSWKALIHVPYLGVVALFLGVFLAIALLAKLLR